MIALAWPAAAEEPAVYELQADGLACPFCAYGIEKQLGALEGVASVETDVKSGTVTITMEEGATLDEADAERAVDRAGFMVRDFRRREQS
jgi:mercuric ion binding protein